MSAILKREEDQSKELNLYWDIFELNVIGEGNDEDNAITVRIVPTQPPAGSLIGPLNSTKNMYGMTSAVTGYNPAGQLQVTVVIGRGMLDGSWHAVWIDLVEAVEAAWKCSMI